MELGSQFNVEFWPGVIIQRGILSRGHNSTWIFDPSTRGIATQEGVKIQRDQNLTAKEGHNSTKKPLNIDPGLVFYLISAYAFQVLDFPIIDMTKFSWIMYSWSRTRVFRPHLPRDESRDRSKKSPFFDNFFWNFEAFRNKPNVSSLIQKHVGEVFWWFMFLSFVWFIIIPNIPTPQTTLWGVYLFHNDYISVTKWFLHNNSFSFWLKMMILHICICWPWPKENRYWFMGPKGQRSRSNSDLKLFTVYAQYVHLLLAYNDDTSHMCWLWPKDALY